MRDSWATRWWDDWLPAILLTMIGIGVVASLCGVGLGAAWLWGQHEDKPSRTGTITGAQIRASLMRCGANGGLDRLQLRKSGRQLYATCGNGLAGAVEVKP